MMIFTSNYAKVSRARNDEDRLYVRISSSVPEWFTKPYVSLPELYPSWDLVNGYKNGMISTEEYTRRYEAVLTPELRETVLTKLKTLCDQNDTTKVVFLCWCGGFCHRHIVNKWLNGNGELY